MHYCFVSRCRLGAFVFALIELALGVIITGCNKPVVSQKPSFSPYDQFQSGGSFTEFSPSLSHSEAYVVYSSPRSGKGDIYTVKLDGTGTKRLTTDNDYEGDPCYTLDDKYIIYVRQQNRNLHIWIMNTDGSHQKPVTSGSSDQLQPAISPDGKRILYIEESQNPQGFSDICSINLDGSSKIRITSSPGYYSLTLRRVIVRVSL